MRYLYADTSIWNRLCDQDADPKAMCSALALQDVGIVVGFNVLYEMAKPFFIGTEEATARGQKLLNYMKHYLSLRVPIVKENWALLVEEALDVTGTAPMESFFRNSSQYEMAIQEIDKLLRREIAPEVAEFFAGRKSLVRTSRDALKDQLAARPGVKTALGSASEEAIANLLRTDIIVGRTMLLGHLRREFPEHPPESLAIVARLLLQSPKYRASRALTRSDLYLAWRCATRGSLRADLPDDTFHVVSASYCDIFVTTEADQADIALHAVEGIEARVFNQDEIISDGLLNGVQTGAAVQSGYNTVHGRVMRLQSGGFFGRVLGTRGQALLANETPTGGSR